MAMNEPKARNKMIAAPTMPTSSDKFVDTWLTAWIAWPPNSTSTPGVRALSAMLITFLTSGRGLRAPNVGQLTVAYAVRPSLLICAAPCGAYGLDTPDTDCAWVTRSSILEI